MTGALTSKHQLYPLIGIISTLVIMIVGLLTVKSTFCIYYLGAVFILLFLFGYGKACAAAAFAAALMCFFFAGLTYVISRDILSTYAAINRTLTVCVAVIPGLGMRPVNLVRNFAVLKMPRTLTLGMMITLNFLPLLSGEISRVREAMKTRGAGSILHPRVFYRAFLLPLVVRLVNISDTLALSVETRGFSTEKDAEYTVYKTVKLRICDLVYFLVVVILSVFALI